MLGCTRYRQSKGKRTVESFCYLPAAPASSKKTRPAISWLLSQKKTTTILILPKNPEKVVLTKTFCHVDGISANTEKLLWEHGVHHWDDFVSRAHELPFLSQNKIEKIRSELSYSKEAFERKNLQYFKDMLPSKEHWRMAGLGRT